MVCFTPGVLSPGATLLLPTVGACLIIVYAGESTWVGRLLSLRSMVFVGLLSYSLYLWHMPIFAFIRAWCQEPPSKWLLLGSLVGAFVCSLLSWHYVEKPFRDKTRFSRREIFVWAGMTSCIFVVVGLYLNASYGVMSRIYDPSQITVAEMDKRQYNERVFKYKNDAFVDNAKQHLLVIGNSFGRDFVNMVKETFDTTKLEIVYRDDVNEELDKENETIRNLALSADVIVFASPTINHIKRDAMWEKIHGVRVFFLGTKFFGWNENWVIRVPKESRGNLFNSISSFGLEAQDAEVKKFTETGQFISLLKPVIRNGCIPITDEQGRLLSTDRAHVTRYGAIYFGQRVIEPSPLGQILKSGWTNAKEFDTD